MAKAESSPVPGHMEVDRRDAGCGVDVVMMWARDDCIIELQRDGEIVVAIAVPEQKAKEAFDHPMCFTDEDPWA